MRRCGTKRDEVFGSKRLGLWVKDIGSCLDGEAQTRATKPSGSSPGPDGRSAARFHASGGQQFTIAPIGK